MLTFLKQCVWLAMVGAVLSDVNPIRLITRNRGHHETNILWTIEDFKDMPYVKLSVGENGPFFHSPPFPAKSDGVKWSLSIDYNSTRASRGEGKSFDLFVHFYGTETIYSFSGSCECKIWDIEGKTHNEKIVKSEVYEEVPFEFWSFFNREQLETNQALLPDGDLTIGCVIRGYLKTNLSQLDDIIPTEELTEVTCAHKLFKDLKSILKPLSISDDSELSESSEFFERYSNEITVSSSGNKFLFQRNVLVSRAPLINEMLGYGSTLNMTEHLTPEELESFLTFTLKGSTPNLIEHCPALFKVARQFGFNCLKITCEDILMRHSFPRCGR